ncbi:MAG: hypothetical protein L6Q57_09985 [Alphaproteobacteria bacterium]|nr:hypothetical protein [Alphaproteobacteria bacterium]
MDLTEKDLMAIRASNDEFLRKLHNVNMRAKVEREEYPQRQQTVSALQQRIVGTPTNTDNAIFVPQGFYGETRTGKGKIGTMGLATCVGIVLVCEQDQAKRAVVAHVDTISDGVGFVIGFTYKYTVTEAYLLGGCSDMNMTYNLIEALREKGIKTVVSTNLGLESFIYDVDSGEFSLNCTRKNFKADWARIDAANQLPLMQCDLLEKNRLRPVMDNSL